MQGWVAPVSLRGLLLASIVDGLLVTTFLILFIASIAVVGSMLVLALWDLVMSRKRQPASMERQMQTPLKVPDLEEAMSNWRHERDSADDFADKG